MGDDNETEDLSYDPHNFKNHREKGPDEQPIHVLYHFRQVNYQTSRIATAKKYIEDAKTNRNVIELKVIPLKLTLQYLPQVHPHPSTQLSKNIMMEDL
ncbi:hypothetical protein BY996DRAFT_6508370, partial [Phakopsora pachyrhizi]